LSTDEDTFINIFPAAPVCNQTLPVLEIRQGHLFKTALDVSQSVERPFGVAISRCRSCLSYQAGNIGVTVTKEEAANQNLTDVIVKQPWSQLRMVPKV